MTVKLLVFAALVSVLALLMSACGGSGTKLYDAKATYTCLTRLPEYRPPSAIIKTVRESRSGTFLMPGRPARMTSMSWGGNVSREPFWLISFFVATPGAHHFADVQIYDDARAAAKSLAIANRSKGRGDFVLRNALVDAVADVPKKARSLILGCLRTA